MLAKFHGRYESIMESNEPGTERDKLLANLMTDLEREYKIPAQYNPEWEKDNKPVIALYRIISESRITV